MDITLRPEEEKDYRRVEELTREAFWNMYVPGCDEHLLVHRLRTKKQFIPALDYVALHNDTIVGNIIYVETKLTDTNGTDHKVTTFGPVSVLPEYQSLGVGSKLITHTAQLAREMGYKAILIYGDPEYYKRFGFKRSKAYGITNQDKKYPAALQALELYPGALNGINGIFDEGNFYAVDPEELQAFEKGFPPKEKAFTKTQERFLELANKYL